MTIAIAVGALLGGGTADKLGRRRVFSATVGLYAVGAALVALASGQVELTLGVVVLGLASGADLPASIALVAERVPSAVRGRMVAVTHVMWTVGIVLASAAAFAVSSFGVTGTRVVFGALALAALVTLGARRRALPRLGPAVPVRLGAAQADGMQTSEAASAGVHTLVLIALFYVLYTLVANTFGSFRTYLLVVVGGTDQTTATAIAFGVTVLGLVGTILFSTIADSGWRRRVYPVAGGLLVSSQVILAMTAGGSAVMTGAALVVYALAYPYVGEGLYKVWAQEAVAPPHRATFQGVTIAAARAVAALFAMVTPLMLTHAPALLFWLLTALATAAVITGHAVMQGWVRARRL